MLSQILAVMQEFEQTHGCRPQVICLNARHMLKLMDECADLFDRKRPLPLGVRIMVLPEHEAPRPRAMWLPPRVRASRSDADDAPVLLSWATGRPSPAN